MSKDIKAKPQPQTRVFSHKRTIHSDLFKLQTAAAVVDLGWNKKSPIWEQIDHNHFYRTFDSDGKQQTRTNSVAGHFHVATVVEQGDGQHPVVTFGPPVKEIYRVIDGEITKVIEPISSRDKHIHVAQYLQSAELEVRQVNLDASRMVTAEVNKTKPIDGVAGSGA